MGSRHQAHRAAVTDSNMSLIQLNGVSRRYKTEGFEVTALDNVSLSIDKGEFVAIMGQSGSGKSTLMNILGCLDTPSEGEYRIHGQSVSSLNPDQLSALRLKTFGFVFQRYQRLSSLNATENVALPAYTAVRLAKIALKKRNSCSINLAFQTKEPGRELSGGQQQRSR